IQCDERAAVQWRDARQMRRHTVPTGRERGRQTLDLRSSWDRLEPRERGSMTAVDEHQLRGRGNRQREGFDRAVYRGLCGWSKRESLLCNRSHARESPFLLLCRGESTKQESMKGLLTSTRQRVGPP